MKVCVTITMGLAGCKRESVIELEDDMEDHEIDDAALQEVMQIIEWGWEKEPT